MPSVIDELRCPSCGRVAWFRDPLAVEGTDDGRVIVGYAFPEAVFGGGWSCMECGNELPRWLQLARRLDAVARERAPRPYADR